VGLSKRRVEAVTTAIVEAGISKELISGNFYGETRPAVQTKDGERKAENRRVEIKTNCN
jgi:outer membrane protein OmpA-like peptidoglycan-associated protein